MPRWRYSRGPSAGRRRGRGALVVSGSLDAVVRTVLVRHRRSPPVDRRGGSESLVEAVTRILGEDTLAVLTDI
ncbi:hypothetical protein [Streptomyces sp. DSM 41534]